MEKYIQYVVIFTLSEVVLEVEAETAARSTSTDDRTNCIAPKNLVFQAEM